MEISSISNTLRIPLQFDFDRISLAREESKKIWCHRRLKLGLIKKKEMR